MAVRNESVRVSVEDAGFTSGMAKMAAATALLERNLDSLDGTNVSTSSSTTALGKSTETTTKRTKDYNLATALAEETTARFKKQLREQAKEMLDATQNTGLASDAIRTIGNDSDSSGRQIDRLSGRLALFAQAAAVFGPALAPLGAATVPALAGLTAQLGALVAAVGVGALAFNGIGDGLDALNTFQLEPTADNLEALRLQMEKIGPAGEDFVRFLDRVAPQFSALQMAARDGLFPGVEDGINNLLPLLPQVSAIITEISTAMGSLASDAGSSLAGPEWAGFFDYLENEAAPILVEFGRTVGNFAQGFANLMVGLSPATSDFSGGLLEMSRSFAEWSRSLESNQGFQSFLDYVREAGPKAVDFLKSLVDAIAGVAEAAAPVGDVVLPILTDLLDIIASIASSPLGPALIGIAAAASTISRAMALASLATLKFDAAANRLGGSGTRAASAINAISKAATALVGLTLAGAVIDGIRDSAVGAAPEVERLTAALIAADNQEFASEFGGSIKDALDVLDPGTLDTIAGSLNDLGEKGGAAGTAVVSVLGGLTGFLGPMNDAKVSSDQVAQAFGSLDEALTGLVASGGPDRAKAALDALAVSQGLSAEETDTLVSQLPQYEAALIGAANAAALAAEGEKKHASATELAARAAREEAAALRASVEAMREKTTALLGAFDAETRYRESLKAAAAQARSNTQGIRGNSDAALANRNSLGQLAAAWNNQSSAVKNNVARFRESRSAFIETATAMGVPEEAAKRLANRLMEIPKSVVTKIEARGAAEAEAEAARVRAALASINDKTVTIRTIRTNGLDASFPLATERADGGLITGPGGPRDDMIPAWLSNREYVVKADAVSHYGVGFFDKVNAKAFASGGPTDSTQWNGSWGARMADPGRSLRDAADDAGRSLKSLTAGLKESTKALAAEKQQRSEAVSLRGQVGSSLAGDLFGNGLAGFDTANQANKNDARSMLRALREASNKGLDGPLFDLIAASGDLQTAQQFADLGRRQIRRREGDFTETRRAQGRLGGFAVEGKFGQSVEELGNAVREQARTNRRLQQQIRKMEKNVKDGARSGTREGSSDRSRRTSQRARAGR